MMKGEQLLPGLDLEGLQLEVITMDGVATQKCSGRIPGLQWVKTSSNIPGFETALIYPGACFFRSHDLQAKAVEHVHSLQH